jgi:hypothetical protein
MTTIISALQESDPVAPVDYSRGPDKAVPRPFASCMAQLATFSELRELETLGRWHPVTSGPWVSRAGTWRGGALGAPAAPSNESLHAPDLERNEQHGTVLFYEAYDAPSWPWARATRSRPCAHLPAGARIFKRI